MPRNLAVPAPQADVRALERLYRDHFAFVWRTVGRFGIPEAEREDAAQEVFVIVHRRWSDWDPATPPRSWLYGIARRVSADRRRKRERAARRERGVTPPLEPDPPDEVLARTRAKRALSRAIDELEPKRREVFILADVDGLSAPEIAAALGIKLNTVYSRLRLARRDILQTSRRLQGAR